MPGLSQLLLNMLTYNVKYLNFEQIYQKTIKIKHGP